VNGVVKGKETSNVYIMTTLLQLEQEMFWVVTATNYDLLHFHF